MPSTFGQWLIVILALLVGLVGGWVLRDRRAAASPAAPIVEGDPVAGVAELGVSETATVDQERPEAVVDDATASTDTEPARLEANGTADTTPAEADAKPADADSAAATTSEPAEVEPAHAEVQATEADEPTDGPTSVVADQEPAAAETSTETTTTVPAPLAAVADVSPPASDAPETASTPDGTAVAATGTAAANGTAATASEPAGEAADDFRRIQGIGPKMATALQAAGIRTYRQLAELDEAALRDTIRAAGLRAAPSLATWSQQAKVLVGATAEADKALPAAVGAGADA
ncbi:Helix-hairpin-helix domain-containing protein [Micromonospora rhizosphaerae]|uniref:Helix-hairpin-helix domain-containing protein n=1 Tax=Micromonospora rhizosphaerae TaxID=568872 RepID=A0A1C6SVT4_9ACTN|nr:helix-hairpin-helix domain-containing protein [Micromonospora rhizosphaerae]SCL33479.1 Helix-hairpin-helix domain-containing protein [Micromonospora rhizosphaerae]